jgi:hypothetical protein
LPDSRALTAASAPLASEASGLLTLSHYHRLIVAPVTGRMVRDQ